jgi:hypothetical protein
MARLKRAIGGIRSEHRHVSHAVAKLKSAHAIAELIDFPDDIVAHYKGWAAGGSLRVEMATDQRVGILKAEARTRTRTSPGPAVGRGASTTSSSSGLPKRRS